MKKLFKTLMVVAIVVLLFVQLSPLSTTAKLKDYHGQSIYVYNLTEDKEVLNLKGETQRAPASLVKLMTVYVSLQHIDDLSALAPIDVDSYLEKYEQNSSMAGFYGLETTTYRDLLYGSMLPSGGECADSLAINLAGDQETFVSWMNEEAQQLGLEDTYFKNPDGMDEEGQYASAKDIAMLLKTALQNGDFRAIFTKREYRSTSTLDHPEGVYMISTVFKRLQEYDQLGYEIIGGKSGTTQNAGLCWATLGVKDGKEYLVIVMGVPYDDVNHTNDGQVLDTLKIYEAL